MPKAKANKKRSPRPVDPVNNGEDFRCLFLLMLGRSNKAIMREMDYSPGMITYRARKFEISRMDYRNGDGPLVSYIDQATEGFGRKKLLAHLRQHVKG
jgi:hypothetical protein